ncbi:MbtH family NRPS accessory protein [Ideonella sp. 4Y16]|uniref:MbtH family NRPS accessory protein n=1 Tax=Ideonella alba TaxID=2824118 RepID=A0A940YEC1_9BURK|nr:MbtH family NRPS accessory protein [Ideonella alba]MBQ0933561.1 MbtH family NRPS accessory protein [Ideonella alba]MBQ0946371.1 MbtH family NRPS accessory protein [Ideonella alba]
MEADKYVVVMNSEEQYSLWPADRAVPAGWAVQTEPNNKEDCLDYINRHWTDMTPASLRKG